MIIASRMLKIISNDESTDIPIDIFMPEPDAAAWVCRYEINWPDRKRSSFAAGIDPVQALHFALQKIGLDLYMSDHHATGRLIWTEKGAGYGFPIPKNGRELLVGQDREF